MIIESDSVIRLSKPLSILSSFEIRILIEHANKSQLKRSRICLHNSNTSPIHEMVICALQNTYIQPAKHLDKSESLTVIEGKATLFIFNEEGTVSEKIKLGSPISGRSYFYKMNTAFYHTLLVESNHFVFHEVTSGPFDLSDTVSANWSPSESDLNEKLKFFEFLKIANVGSKF